jgi:hypothetical protein
MEFDFKPVPEILASEKVVIGRKLFFLDLKENNRGRFMQITEDVGGRRDRIMLPVEVFEEFSAALGRLLAEHKRLG